MHLTGLLNTWLTLDATLIALGYLVSHIMSVIHIILEEKTKVGQGMREPSDVNRSSPWLRIQ